LELHDIEKEFILVDARLRLLANEEHQSVAAGEWAETEWNIMYGIMKRSLCDIVYRSRQNPLLHSYD